MTALVILFVASVVVIALCYRQAAQSDREDSE